MADIYTKSTINKIYTKLNMASKTRCKSANDNTIEFQKCYHQAMADNARNLAAKIRGQVEAACTNEKNPEQCVEKIRSLIDYLIQKQETHEQHVAQLEDLEESFLNTGRKLISQELRENGADDTIIDYIMNESSKIEIIDMLSQVCDESKLNKNYKRILNEGLLFLKG